MPTQINCPNCDVSLNLPDAAAGKRVKCTSCSTPFVAPAAAAPEVAPPAVALSPSPSVPVSSPAPAASAPPMAPAGVPAAQASAVAGPSRICLACGYQGRMPKKFPTWVIVLAIVAFPIGLVLLCIKKFKCPQCGTFQD